MKAQDDEKNPAAEMSLLLTICKAVSGFAPPFF